MVAVMLQIALGVIEFASWSVIALIGAYIGLHIWAGVNEAIEYRKRRNRR